MLWYQRTGAGALLRVAGMGILATGYFAAIWLQSRATAGALNGDPLAYLLAAAAFLCGSVGSALAVLGTHIFDRVEVAQRWRRPD